MTSFAARLEQIDCATLHMSNLDSKLWIAGLNRLPVPAIRRQLTIKGAHFHNVAWREFCLFLNPSGRNQMNSMNNYFKAKLVHNCSNKLKLFRLDVHSLIKPRWKRMKLDQGQGSNKTIKTVSIEKYYTSQNKKLRFRNG